MQQSSSTFDEKRFAKLKKLVKEKEKEKDQKWKEWVYSESNNFVEKVISQYQEMIDFAEKYDLTPKSFDDFLNFMGIKEKYEEEYKKDKELEEIYQKVSTEYTKLNYEYNKLEKESKAFKKRISFKG